MSVLCAWASIDERGKATGGAVGDQTGREVKIGEYYNFGQTVVLRCNDRKKARKMSNAMKHIAKSNLCGYDQTNRTSLFVELQKVKFDYKKLTAKCETDCSAMIACAVACAYGKELISRNCWTGNLEEALVSTGEFKALTLPVSDDRYLLKGDIILNKKSHVIMAIESGTKANSYGSTYETLATMNFRSNDSLKSKYIYCKIPKGTRFKAFRFGEDWLYLRYNNKWGFVKRKGRLNTYCRKAK